MYSAAQLRRGLGRSVEWPGYAGRELNRLYHRRGYRRDHNPDGVDIPTADWDNLVVLDACRYDLFVEHNTLPGVLEARRSKGSHTVEFLHANFGGRRLHDTVYVTATPQFHRHREALDAAFHATVDVWHEGGWDDDAGTVRPETMTQYAKEAAAAFPDKRLLVHYLQPHYPFLTADGALGADRLSDGEGSDIWGRLARGTAEVSADTVREAYAANLDAALPHVAEFLDAVDGRSVVTADHGNMLGERARPVPIREWGHPPGVYTPELVQVPWLVQPADQRRDVVSEPPSAAQEPPSPDPEVDEDVTARLEQLGYRT